MHLVFWFQDAINIHSSTMWQRMTYAHTLCLQVLQNSSSHSIYTCYSLKFSSFSGWWIHASNRLKAPGTITSTCISAFYSMRHLKETTMMWELSEERGNCLLLALNFPAFLFPNFRIHFLYFCLSRNPCNAWWKVEQVVEFNCKHLSRIMQENF